MYIRFMSLTCNTKLSQLQHVTAAYALKHGVHHAMLLRKISDHPILVGDVIHCQHTIRIHRW